MRTIPLLALFLASPALAQTPSVATARSVVVVSPNYAFNISMQKGEAQLFRTATPYSNLVVGDPKVIAANAFGDRTLSVQAMEPGISTLMFLDPDNNILGEIRIAVSTRGADARSVQIQQRPAPHRAEHLVAVRAGNWGPLSIVRPAEFACDWGTAACRSLTRAPPIVQAPGDAPVAAERPR